MTDRNRGGSYERDRGREREYGRGSIGRDTRRSRESHERDRGELSGGWRDDDMSGLYGYEGEGYLRGGNADFGNRSEYSRGRGGRYDRESGESSGSREMPRGERTPREGYRSSFGRFDSGRDDIDAGAGRWNERETAGYPGLDFQDRATGYVDTGVAGWEGARTEGVDFNRAYSDRANGLWMPERDRTRPSRESFRGRGPKNYRRADERIHEEVCERLTEDHDVDASDIEVNVLEGVVTLTGSVNDRWMKRRAEDIAASIGGVKDVENRIRTGTWRDQISEGDERTKPETD